MRMKGMKAAAVFAALAAWVMASGARADLLLLSEGFSGAIGTQPTGFSTSDAEGAGDDVVSRNDGAGVYEQRFLTSAAPEGDADTIAWYDVPSDTDRGVWRDTTISVINRFSGGGDTATGVVFRASDNTAVLGGDWYLLRIINGSSGAIELIRVNGGSSSGTLALDSTGGAFVDTTNQLLTVDVRNVADADTDNVRIVATLYAGTTVGSGVVRQIDFTDTAANAITRSGGVGFRTSFDAGSGFRSVFNDLSVSSTNPNLLWYDDYYDGAAPRMQAFTSGVTQSITGGKYNFSGVTSGDQARASIDWDAETSGGQWENVRASTLMRWNTGGNGGRLEAGLILRETDMASTSTGDYYYFALIRNEDAAAAAARIFRVVNGVATQIAATATFSTSLVPEGTNLYLSFQAITNALGNVDLLGIASLSIDLSSPFVSLAFTDTNAARILGPGSAGFRVSGAGSLPSGTVNFDNFTVEAVPAPAALPAGLALVSLVAMRRRRR